MIKEIEIEKRKRSKEEKINKELKKKKIEISYVTLDFIEENLLLKEYMLMQDQYKDSYISLYSNNMLNVLKDKLEYDMKDKYFLFINGNNIINLEGLKHLNSEQQKEYLCIEEEKLEHEEYEFYIKFKNIKPEEKDVEERKYYKMLKDEYADLGELLFKYFKTKYDVYFECLKINDIN